MPTTEKTIQSDAFIGVESTAQIISDAFVGVETTQQISSDTNLTASPTQTIASDTNLTGSPIQTIEADSFVGQETEQILLSDSVIQVEQTVTIVSDTFITPIFVFEGESDLTVPSEEELDVETDSDNPIPSAPTSLVAVDSGLGDSIDLNWISTASFFNVFRKDPGPTFVKLNPLPIESTNYQVGNISGTTTFVVRAVNGLGQESPNSNEAIATPTLNTFAQRFSNPTWSVSVGGGVRTDAILSSVTLSYGSTFSTAIFSLPVDPRGGSPTVGASVNITINGRLVFRGTVSVRSDIIDTGGGLRVSYTCFSNIIDLTKDTIFGTDVDMVTTSFNVFEKLPDGKGIIRNKATAEKILSPFDIFNVPVEFPGAVDITDLTPLAAMELVLQKLGNYKVYHDMSSGENFAYRFGSGGFTVRSFTFGDAAGGGNILSYNVQRSDQDVVKQVTVIGAITEVRVRRTLTNLDVGEDPDGRRRLLGAVTGKNIRDVQVFGFLRSKPAIRFNEKVQVLLEDIDEQFSESSIDTSFSLAIGTVGSSDGDENQTSEDKSLRPIIDSLRRFSSQRQTIGARLFYTGKDKVTISLNSVPKNWFTEIKSGSVENVKVGLEGDGKTSVSVLLRYGFFIGTIVVEYTIDEEKPSVVAGSGTPSKSITDGQFKIIKDNIGGFNNEADVLLRMNARASNELARLQKEELSGSITIIGDETLDLRSSVSVLGERLEISGITHSFQNGFTTTVELTNEPFFANIIIPPSLKLQGQNKRESEKGRRFIMETFANQELAEADNSKYLASQKEDIDRDTNERGPYAIYQD